MQICLCLQVPFSIHESVIALPLPASPVILLQDPFEIRRLVKDLAGELRVGDDLPVAIVLQRARADVEPFANFFAREKMLAAKERPVRLGYFPNPFSDASQGREDHLHLARFHTQVLNRFHHRFVVFVVLSDFTQSNRSTSSRL